MEADRWRRVSELFHAALELPAPERTGYLGDVCSDDDLRREVELLLEAQGRAKEFLTAPAVEVAARRIAELEQLSILGRRIGDYRVESLIASGGMGNVYAAVDLRLGRRMALKLLPPHFTADPKRLNRFRQEAAAVSALNHPNIVTIHDIAETDDGVYFIAMELVEGQTLRKLIAASPIDLPTAVGLAAQIGAALTAAHAVGIIHRDIKPPNVMVRPDGYVKVLDFGLAKLLKKPAFSERGRFAFEEPATEPGQVMGTPRYIPPEILSGREADARADVFSLGVVLYEMVAGRPPFDGETPSEVIAAVLEHQPPPLASFAEAPPAALERLVGRCLEKDRELRYQSADAVVADLNRLRLELEIEERESHQKGTAIPFLDGRSLTPPSEGKDVSARNLEAIGGAVPLDSAFYLVRPQDHQLTVAMARRDSTVLIKGPRQVGKTSLLARGMHRARQVGETVVCSDLQKLSAHEMTAADSFYRALAGMLADQLGAETQPQETWSPHRGPGVNFERYLRRVILGDADSSSRLLWGLDEVDRLFATSFGSEVFGLFRSWHNERSLDPGGPWRRLTLVLSYATEAHLFIRDMNQSPFNVGTRITLEDFTLAEVAQLNERYRSPLKNDRELEDYFRLLGGQPYLVRRGFYEMVSSRLSLAALDECALRPDGPFGDHLRRMLGSLQQDPALCEMARSVIQRQPLRDADRFYRLRSSGVLSGDSWEDARPRCEIYARYLKEYLG